MNAPVPITDMVDVDFTVKYMKCADMNPVGIYGHKYCVTIVDTDGDRYRLYAFDNPPAIKQDGHMLPIRIGDRLRGRATVREINTGKLKSLAWKTLVLL